MYFLYSSLEAGISISSFELMKKEQTKLDKCYKEVCYCVFFLWLKVQMVVIRKSEIWLGQTGRYFCKIPETGW